MSTSVIMIDESPKEILNSIDKAFESCIEELQLICSQNIAKKKSLKENLDRKMAQVSQKIAIAMKESAFAEHKINEVNYLIDQHTNILSDAKPNALAKLEFFGKTGLEFQEKNKRQNQKIE